MDARLCQVFQHLRHVRQLDPVELEILPRREMAVAAVVDASHMRKLPELVRGQRAIGDGDPQHVGVQLQIDPVHQPERLELVLGKLARKPPRHLAAELRRALRDESAVEFVINIHSVLQMARGDAKPPPAPARRWAMRRSGPTRG